MESNQVASLSPLLPLITRSGTLPVTNDSHYSHWVKYQGGKFNGIYEDRIKRHLRKERRRRPFSQVRSTTTLKFSRLPSISQIPKYKTYQSDNIILNSEFSLDLDRPKSKYGVDSDGWWPTTPLPEITDPIISNTEPNKEEPPNVPLKPSFTISDDLTVKQFHINKLSKRLQLSKELLNNIWSSRRIHIYIASAETDMTIERVHLEEHVWPHLRQLCYQQNADLIIHDLHTYNDELKSHGEQEWLSQISRCINNIISDGMDNIKGLILLGTNFDNQNLPKFINQIQFDQIKQAMKSDMDKIDRIHIKMTDLKIAQSQIKQQYFTRRESSFASVSSEKSINSRSNRPAKNANRKIESINCELTKMKQELDQIQYDTNIEIFHKLYSTDTSNDSEILKLNPEIKVIDEFQCNDPMKREAARKKWLSLKKHANHILTKYSSDIEIINRSCTTELEINLLNKLISTDKCLVMTRSFTNHLPPRNLAKSKEMLLKQIPESHQIRFEINSENGIIIKPDIYREHKSYLNEMGKDIRKILEQNLRTEIQNRIIRQSKSVREIMLPNIEENDLELLLKEMKIQLEYLEILNQRSKYHLPNIITSSEQLINAATIDRLSTIIVSGSQMTGKSSIMMKFINDFINNQLNEHKSEQEIMFIYRFLGISSQCDNNRLLLRSICSQLIYETGLNISLPKEMTKLKTLFFHLTNLIEIPVLICLDGVENLSDLSEACLFDWLPNKSNFQSIISITNNHKEYKNVANVLLHNDPSSVIIPVTELTETEILQLIDENWPYLLAEQRNDLITHCMSNKTIGYLLSCFELVQFWTELTSTPRLGAKLEQNILYYFAKLEDLYGETLIRRFIGILTAVDRNGVTLNELSDLLTISDSFKDYVKVKLNDTTMLRCNYSFIQHLLMKIQKFLIPFYGYCETLTWANLTLKQASRDRYLNIKEKSIYHNLISLYFMNDENDIEIYNKSMENDVTYPNLPYFIIKQKQCFVEKIDFNSLNFNIRKITILPHHLLALQNAKLLKMTCIFNLYWLQAYLACYSIENMLDLLQTIILQEPDDMEYGLLLSTLKLVPNELFQHDPSQISSQLSGRLKQIVIDDKLSKDSRKLRFFYHLLQQMKINKWSKSSVLTKCCLKQPDSVNSVKIIETFGNITCMTTNNNCTQLYLSTDEGILLIWSTGRNKVMKMIYGLQNTVMQMILNIDNTKMATATRDYMELWNIETSHLEVRLKMKFDPYKLLVSEDRSLISALFFGTSGLETWEFNNFQHISTNVLSLDTSINNNGEILVYSTCKGFKALIAVAFDNKAYLADIKTGELASNILKCKEEGSAIIHLNMSSNYFILCLKAPSPDNLKTNEYCVETFNNETYQNLRRIRGCILDNIVHFSINSVGSHAISCNINPTTNCTDLSVWNLETEEHKHCSTIENINPLVIIREFSVIFMVTNFGKSVIKINIQSALQTAKTAVVKCQNFQLISFSLNSNYILLKSDDNSLIKCYNMSRSKYTGRLVIDCSRLANSEDVLIHNNDKLIILTDKEHSLISPECKDVYQTIKVFDLSQGHMTNQTTQLVIYPSRKDEFMMLNDEDILGLSETRSHLIIWNIISGQIQRRIRPNAHLLNIHDTNSRLSLVGEAKHSTRGFEKSIHDIVIDKILISQNRTTLVASNFSNYLLVFSLLEFQHISTLTTDTSMLHLQVANLSTCGHYLIQNNFNESDICTNLTVWNTMDGEVQNNLVVDNSILAVAIDNLSLNAVFIEENVGVMCWKLSKFTNCHENKFEKLYNGHFPKHQLKYEIIFAKSNKLFVVSTSVCFHLWSIDYSSDDTEFHWISSFQPDQQIHSILFCCNDTLLAFTLKGYNDIYTTKLYQDKSLYNNKQLNLDYLEKIEYDNSSDESDFEM